MPDPITLGHYHSDIPEDPQEISTIMYCVPGIHETDSTVILMHYYMPDPFVYLR
jgi:hypothetical protein